VSAQGTVVIALKADPERRVSLGWREGFLMNNKGVQLAAFRVAPSGNDPERREPRDGGRMHAPSATASDPRADIRTASIVTGGRQVR